MGVQRGYKLDDREKEKEEATKKVLQLLDEWGSDLKFIWFREVHRITNIDKGLLRNIINDLKKSKDFTEYSMSDQSWIVKMREAATQMPDSVARSSTAIGTPEDIIPIFERFMKAGVNHFVIRFWGKNYFGSIDKFASHVMPHLRELAKQ